MTLLRSFLADTGASLVMANAGSKQAARDLAGEPSIIK
jgi:hypothetical protein